MYGIAAAKPKEQPMVFPVDTSLNEPLVIYRPYANEFSKPTVTKLVQTDKPASKKQNPKPQAPKASGQRDYGAGEIQDLIRKYSQQFGIDPSSPLCIAEKESGFNPNARNKSSSATGVFQYLASTWRATDEGKAGYSATNPEQNIKAAVKYMAIHKNTKPWTVAPSCPPLQFL